MVGSGELGVIQGGVEPARGQKLLMGTLLGDQTVPDHQDLVGVLDGGQAVGDDEAGYP